MFRSLRLAAFCCLLVVGQSWAGQISGVIRSVDLKKNTLTIKSPAEERTVSILAQTKIIVVDKLETRQAKDGLRDPIFKLPSTLWVKIITETKDGKEVVIKVVVDPRFR